MSKKKEKLDPFHYHEALDRVHVMGCIINDNVLFHPVIKKHKKLSKKVEQAMLLLAEVYREISGIELTKFEKLKWTDKQ
jgi:predicted O-methyltransferase YrrM